MGKDRVEHGRDPEGSAYTNVWLDGKHSRLLHHLPEGLAFAKVRQARIAMSKVRYVQH
jgi:hypothetical protein